MDNLMVPLGITDDYLGSSWGWLGVDLGTTLAKLGQTCCGHLWTILAEYYRVLQGRTECNGVPYYALHYALHYLLLYTVHYAIHFALHSALQYALHYALHSTLHYSLHYSLHNQCNQCIINNCWRSVPLPHGQYIAIFYTIQTALHWLNSSMYANIYC